MKIYTKKGDQGQTALIGGTRVPKYHIRIEAYGTIDELNSHIGLVRDHCSDENDLRLLKNIQNQLFSLGALLAADPDKSKMDLPKLKEDYITAMEIRMDEMEADLPELKSFILPGGHPSVSFTHVARCVCRRAERKVVYLEEQDSIPDFSISYLNRLSDYLFVLSRKLTKDHGLQDNLWNSQA